MPRDEAIVGDSQWKFIAFSRSGRSKQLKRLTVEPSVLTVTDAAVAPACPRQLAYSIGDMILGVFSIACYIADIVLEARLAAFYYAAATTDYPKHAARMANQSCQQAKIPEPESYMAWFYTTLGFIVIPGMICGIVSLSWHIADLRMQLKTGTLKRSPLRQALRFILPFILLGPVLHNIEAIWFALAARRAGSPKHQAYLYEQALFEDADAALLRIIECFLESLPQLVVQLYIMLASANLATPLEPPDFDILNSNSSQALPLCTSLPKSVKAGLLDESTSNVDPVCNLVVSRMAIYLPSLPLEIDCQLTLQTISIASTLLAAAWALVSYQRALRRFLFSRRQLHIFPSGLVLFAAHACLIAGRVIAITLFVQTIGWAALGALLFCHALVMFLWLQTGGCISNQKSLQNHHSPISRGFFNLVLALIYTSAYLNVFDTPSRGRFAVFFGMTLLENTAFVLAWFFVASNTPTLTASTTLFGILTASLSLIWGGVFILAVYYKVFHPNVWSKAATSKGQHETMSGTMVEL